MTRRRPAGQVLVGPAPAPPRPAPLAAFTRVPRAALPPTHAAPGLGPPAAPPAAPVASLGAPRLVGLSLAWLGLAAATGGFLDDVLPALLATRAGDAGPGAWLPAALLALAVAALGLPVAGRWSDHLRSVRGQRRTPMLAGGALALGALLLGLSVHGLGGVLAVLLLVQAGAALAQAGAQPLLVDVVPPARRGLGAGVKGVAEAAGALVAGAAGGALLRGSDAGLALLLAALASTLAVALVCVRGRDRPVAGLHPDAPPAPRRPFLAAFAAPRGAFRRAMLGRAAGLVAVVVLERALAGSDAGLGGLALLLLLAAAGSLVGGAASDRWGRWQVARPGALLLAGGAGLLLLARGPLGVLLFGGLASFGAGAFLAASWAGLADLAPRPEAGRALGVATSLAACSTAAVLVLLSAVALPAEAAVLAAAALAGLAALARPRSGNQAGGRFAVVTRASPASRRGRSA